LDGDGDLYESREDADELGGGLVEGLDVLAAQGNPGEEGVGEGDARE